MKSKLCFFLGFIVVMGCFIGVSSSAKEVNSDERSQTSVTFLPNPSWPLHPKSIKVTTQHRGRLPQTGEEKVSRLWGGSSLVVVGIMGLYFRWRVLDNKKSNKGEFKHEKND